ncbi:MAG: hypothetical protein ACRCZF_10770, partial [Gemmataceae bacterium]
MPNLYRENEEPIAGYRLDKFLGQGSVAEVWRAIDPSGRKVAIKIIDLAENVAAHKELRAFQLLKNLDHANINSIITARLKGRDGREIPFDKAD